MFVVYYPAHVGAVSFIHRFGASVNHHIHYHCCVIDGVFEPIGDGRIRFRQAPALTQRDRDAVTEQVRRRVLRWFARSGLLDPGDARAMLEWANSGFSVDASVRIAAHDSAGLDKIVRNDFERALRGPAGVEGMDSPL